MNKKKLSGSILYCFQTEPTTGVFSTISSSSQKAIICSMSMKFSLLPFTMIGEFQLVHGAAIKVVVFIFSWYKCCI